MIVQTHLMIANYLRRRIKKETGFNLDKYAFRYGNIRPDLKRNEYGCKHNFEGSIEVYTSLLDKIREGELSKSELAMELGVLTHFTCDYFCKYHAIEEFVKDKLSKHLVYEGVLHFKLFLQILNKEEIVSSKNMPKSVHRIEKEIEKRVEQYKNSEFHIEKDIDFAMNMAYQLVFLAVSYFLEPKFAFEVV